MDIAKVVFFASYALIALACFGLTIACMIKFLFFF